MQAYRPGNNDVRFLYGSVFVRSVKSELVSRPMGSRKPAGFLSYLVLFIFVLNFQYSDSGSPYVFRATFRSISQILIFKISCSCAPGASIPLDNDPNSPISIPPLLSFSPHYAPFPSLALSLPCSPAPNPGRDQGVWWSAVSSPSGTRKRFLTHLQVSKRTSWQHLSASHTQHFL